MKKCSSLFKLFKYIKKDLFPLIISLLMSVSAVVLTVYAATVLRSLTNLISDAATDALAGGNMADILDFNEICVLCFKLLGMYLGAVVCGFLQSFIMAKAVNNISYSLRKDISEKINKMPLRYFDSKQTGDTMSRIANDVDTLSQSLNSAVISTVSVIVQLVLVSIMMFVTNWQMGLTSMVSVPLSAVAAVVVIKTSSKFFKRQQVVLGDLNGKAEEAYSGIATVCAFGQEKKFINGFAKTNRELKKAMFKANMISALTHPIANFINKLGYVAVCIVGGILVSDSGVDMGALAAFLAYVNLFQQSVSNLTQTVSVFQQASAASSRIFEFLEEVEEPDESAKTAHFAGVKGNVEFRNVKFGYDENKPIIKNFNATVTAGQKVAIVGPTGAGKTTLVNLLMRFYEPNEGQILIDGVPINEMPRAEVRSLFSMVLQETWLFEGTVKDNIAYTTDVTEEKTAEVIRNAGLTHYVNSLPQGIDTQLNADGLSGGQKQLLTIARAMAQDSPMMILDEATSNVDTGTEELIQKSMDTLTEGRTSFVIAHRLSTIKNADLILVLKDGDIIEQGNNEKLLAQNGFYAKLYNSQFTVSETKARRNSHLCA